jgi:leader peptidase (prepilin peptidase)/N-methyltransferase
LGGIVVGFAASFLLPQLHNASSIGMGMWRSLLGAAAGAGIVYAILRLGKLLFGREKIKFPADTKIIFSETSLHFPGREIPYGELFWRKSDAIVAKAKKIEMIDRSYFDAVVNPENVHHMEMICTEIILPREAMGFGDVKFMGAIGAFIGWQGAIFALMVSSIIGSAVGVTLILMKRREWSSKIPYGPYIALAAAIWIFCGKKLAQWLFAM